MVIDLNFLRTNNSDQIDIDLAIDEYIDFDRELLTNQSTLIHEVPGNSSDISSNKDDMQVSKVESIKKLLIEEVRRAIEIKRNIAFIQILGKGL